MEVKEKWVKFIYKISRGEHKQISTSCIFIYVRREWEGEARRSYWSITWTLQNCTKRECGEWKISLLNCFSERIRMCANVNLEVKEQRCYMNLLIQIGSTGCSNYWPGKMFLGHIAPPLNDFRVSILPLQNYWSMGEKLSVPIFFCFPSLNLGNLSLSLMLAYLFQSTWHIITRLIYQVNFLD